MVDELGFIITHHPEIFLYPSQDFFTYEKLRESNDERAAAAKAQRLFEQKRKESRKRPKYDTNSPSARGFNLDNQSRNSNSFRRLKFAPPTFNLDV